MTLNSFCIPHSSFRNQTLYPVILAVPKKAADLKAQDRVAFLGRHARKALELSAKKSDIVLGELNKDEQGAPLPFDDTYWAITHNTEYVGGVVSTAPIGIDIEKIQVCSRGLFKKTAGESEWALIDPSKKDFTIFFRYWTSKEAVLKASATGIKDLLKCRIHRIIDHHHLEIDYGNKLWQLEHFFFNDHIASIVQNNFKIEWTIL